MKKEHAISLIKDCLKNTKLIVGLFEIGLKDSLDFDLGIPSTLLEMLNENIYEEVDEALIEVYYRHYDEVLEFDISDEEKLSNLADEIYNHLMQLSKLK